MEPQVTLNVTFKNETQSFLVSDPENTTWADVEAMVKVSFDLTTIQIKYLDEENEEVSINSQGEYEEALKMAVKQGNQLQMQVHEAPPPAVPEKRPVVRAGKKPLAHYSSLVRVLGSDMKTPEGPTAQRFPLAPRDADQPQDKPPDWFTSYLETVSVLSGVGFSSLLAQVECGRNRKLNSDVCCLWCRIRRSS